MGQDDQLEILEPVAQPGDAALQLVERGARVRTGVYERERLVRERVDVDSPDREGRGDRQAMDPGRGGGRERIVARHVRISSSTSSRFCAMCSRETTDSRLRRSSGSVFEG